MRHLLLPLATLLFALTACAQSSHLDRFYHQYNVDSQSPAIDPGVLLNVSFSSNKISAIHCLIIDGRKTPNAAREFRDLEQSLHGDHFEEWFSIRKGKGRVEVLSLDGKTTTDEIAILLVGDDDSGLFFHLKGHFTAADKAKLEAALQNHDSK